MTQESDVTASSTILLPIAEAASRLNLHPSALRSRIRRGVVTAKRGNAGQLLVEVPANAKPASDEAAPSPTSPHDDLAAEIDELRRELSEARIREARTMAERDTATATAAAKVEAAERIITELRAMLEDARRPWWRRWVGK